MRAALEAESLGGARFRFSQRGVRSLQPGRTLQTRETKELERDDRQMQQVLIGLVVLIEPIL